jgi:aminopeptidase
VGDQRVEEYAKLLVDTCIGVQPGWQVLVSAGALGRPLYEEVMRTLARRGAYGIGRISFGGFLGRIEPWVKEASDELLATMTPLEEHLLLNVDATVAIIAPENTRDGSDVDPHKLKLLGQSSRRIQERFMTGDVPWVGCQYPTQALAQDADMTLEQFADFLYGAVLLDWDEERRRMERIAERFDAADEVRIVGADTDLKLSLAGRHGKVDAGGANMPGGEVFYSPVEDATEGTVSFLEFPAAYAGREVTDIRFRFEAGRIVDASARTNEDFLLETLDTDDGARRLGEFGIGCNPGIRRHMKNTLFDEKIYGTVHFAVGNSFPFLRGENVSTVHWDIVKDLRDGGELYADGELLQRNGEWVF